MVHRQLYRNLHVSRERVWESDKRMPPKFADFKDYRDYLRDTYALIVANARDPARTKPLEILSTQSTGYDTTAVNALAGPYGIAKVFTITTAKTSGHLAHQESDEGPDDDGSAICKSLGLPCIPINRRAFAGEFKDEHWFYCALFHNQDANLLEIGKHISQVSVLLTGQGGSIWSSDVSKGQPLDQNSELSRKDSGGLGIAEWRLVVGFVHLPLPYIGARRRSDIIKITKFSEMDPWRLGKVYDRPIARRIAEEAGVPRAFFGQHKLGSVVIFPQPAIPQDTMLRNEFFQYLVGEKIMTRSAIMFWPFVRWVNSILLMRSKKRYAVVYYTERVVSMLIRQPFRFKRMWSKLNGTLYCFCVNRAAAIYKELHLRQ